MGRGNTVICTDAEPQDVLISSLYNEVTFYQQFVTDLQNAKEEVIVESPYLTLKRVKSLLPIFAQLKSEGVIIYVTTRDPREHDEVMAKQCELGIQCFENMGIQVLLVDGGHHRKLAMIDKRITYEGSLNILSQSVSREFMRRIECRNLTNELYKFLGYDRFLR
jgi:phosphatidylserine/phosphatidylglycerophosphate/cardiolipin synthase-like enzyme